MNILVFSNDTYKYILNIKQILCISGHIGAMRYGNIDMNEIEFSIFDTD